MICVMAAHAGRTRRPRGASGKEIRGLIRDDLKAHAQMVAQQRGISLSLYLEELIAADMTPTKEAEPPDQLALTP